MKHHPIHPTRRFGRGFGVVAAALLIAQSGAAWSLEPAIDQLRHVDATTTARTNETPMPMSGGVLLAELKEIKQSVTIKPPLSKNGYRLFACLELDGSDCGKKDYREISSQFCAKEGYSGAEYKVQTRKVKAETLEGGEYCSKNKCKVFEEITCKVPLKKEEQEES